VLAAGWTSDAAELLVLVHPDIRPETITQNDDRCAAAISAVQAFYKGDFSAVGKLAVRQQSGPFRMRAWETLRKIPAGATLTYGEFAVQAGNPRAIRAAAGGLVRIVVGGLRTAGGTLISSPQHAAKGARLLARGRGILAASVGGGVHREYDH